MAAAMKPTLSRATRVVSRAILFYFAIVAKSTIALASSSLDSANPKQPTINLQRPHVDRTPSETLYHLGEECRNLGVDISFDVYGDFHKAKETSFLKRFEAEVANEFQMQDALFIPSGGMAQSIALLIHASTNDDQPSGSKAGKKSCFACHHTSHLLLHEQDAYRELLQMEPIVISTVEKAQGISIPPMMFADVKDNIDGHVDSVSTLILELPHREIGGKLTPWEEVLKMQTYCQQNGIKFHLDGARIFEATTGYDDVPLKAIVSVFDSVYISFYKGLGGISGAMLLGSKEFCDEARVWLRRFGGNLYTQLPYAVSGWSGFRRQWRLEGNDTGDGECNTLMSFREKKKKLTGLVKALSSDSTVSQMLVFDPKTPETNMVHGFIRAYPEDCSNVLDEVEKKLNIRVLSRVRPVEANQPEYRLGFRSRFEWAIGESNGNIDDATFLLGWKELIASLARTAS